MMRDNKFDELTNFKEELERYEKQGAFNDLKFMMECIVNFDYNHKDSYIESDKLIKEFKTFILKIRQAEINEYVLRINMVEDILTRCLWEITNHEQGHLRQYQEIQEDIINYMNNKSKK